MTQEAVATTLATIQLAATGTAGFKVELIRKGRIRTRSNEPGSFIITEAALIDVVDRGLCDALTMFVDHSSFFAANGLRDVAATVEAGSAEYDADTGAITANAITNNTDSGLFIQQLFSDWLATDEENRADIGLSLVLWPEFENDQHSDVAQLTRIRLIDSADFVVKPATYARVLKQLSAEAITQGVLIMPQANDEITPDVENETETSAESPDTAHEWVAALTEATVRAMLRAADLPDATTARLRAGTYDTPDELSAEIAHAQTELAALETERTVDMSGTPPHGGNISLGLNGLEQFTQAYEALISGSRPPEGVRPLSGVREAYILMSGDYNLTGRFEPDQVQLAAVDSSTMAAITADALNKRVMNLFQQYPRWWEPFTSPEDFTSLQDVKWITLGGVGELPTVQPGAPYTELTWDDQEEIDPFTKKGGYLGITLEAMDKDDTRSIQSIPRALAQSAWLTLSKAIAGIFTANAGTGPAMSDGNNLFHAAHNNVNTLPLDYTNWEATRAAMRKQTELNSGERLGALTVPRYLLVPPDLEGTALQLLLSEGEAGTPNNDENPFAQGDTRSARLAAARRHVVVVDLWTDAGDWAAVADPRMYTSIGIGYRFGRTPEIFSVASPTAGLMFTNDVMPIKVRFFFAVGPTDWRGVYKHNVA